MKLWERVKNTDVCEPCLGVGSWVWFRLLVKRQIRSFPRVTLTTEPTNAVTHFFFLQRHLLCNKKPLSGLVC